MKDSKRWFAEWTYGFYQYWRNVINPVMTYLISECGDSDDTFISIWGNHYQHQEFLKHVATNVAASWWNLSNGFDYKLYTFDFINADRMSSNWIFHLDLHTFSYFINADRMSSNWIFHLDLHTFSYNITLSVFTLLLIKRWWVGKSLQSVWCWRGPPPLDQAGTAAERVRHWEGILVISGQWFNSARPI
jgi:hypothetical protein